MTSAAAVANRERAARGRRIALFGGTFDPIHLGHLAVARAAVESFHLDQVHFIPSARPPHKHVGELLPFAHRFAMVALACAGHARFVPSLVEQETSHARPHVFYSVDTVRRFRRKFLLPGDRLYFLLGADSFLDIPNWRDYQTLLDLCDFIVANRPGCSSAALRKVIPPRLLRQDTGAEARHSPRSIALRHTEVHLLDTVASGVSATAVRSRLDRGKGVRGLVLPVVHEYITKQRLYGTLDR